MEPRIAGVGSIGVLVAELLSRAVARRTDPGQVHVILSESGLDERLRRQFQVDPGAESEASIRRVRNALVHGVLTTNYDELLDPGTSLEHERLAWYEAFRDQLHAAHAPDNREDLSDQWLEVAAVIADAFVQHLVESAETLSKLEPDEAERVGRSAAESAIAAARWSQVVGDRLDTTSVVQLLGVTRQALAKRQVAGSVVGLLGRGTTWYPTWQFNIEKGEIRPEVRDIVGAFRDRIDDIDPFVIASWAVTPQHEDLNGLTPAYWLRLGESPHQLRTAAERAASRLAR